MLGTSAQGRWSVFSSVVTERHILSSKHTAGLSLSLSLSLSLITALACISMAQASVIRSKMTFWNLQRKVWDEVRNTRVQHTRDFRTKTYGKNKKGNCDLLSHNSDFFFLAIASLYLTILRKKSQNCEIKSRSNLFLF